MAVIIVILLATVIAGGYFFLYRSGKFPAKQTSGTKTNSQTAQVTENDFQSIQDSVLKKHFVAQINKGQYRVESTSSGKGEVMSLSQYRTEGNQLNSRITQSQSQNDFSDLIVIANTVFIKDFTDGKWWKQKTKAPDASSDEAEENKIAQNILEYKQKPNKYTYNQVGVESCGKVDCYKYEEMENGRVIRTFWFNDEDYLLKKEEFVYGEFTSTNDYTYDNIEIKEPSPAKEVPEGKDIYEYYGQGPNNVNDEQELNQSENDINSSDGEEIPNLPE